MAEETLKKNGADYGEQNIITLPACTSAAWATVSGRETASTSS